MFKVGYAQEIITPPTGVGLAGYFNKRPNEGMYDDLYVKVIMIEAKGKLCGFVSFDLGSVPAEIYTDLEAFLNEKYGKELYQNLIVSATHTHTGPEIRFRREEWDDRTYYAYDLALDGAKRAIIRAIMNLLPAELEVGSVYNNPYAFVRRYFMKNGTIVTNPGWGNPDIEKPESELDRTISFLKIIQGGRLAALICNIANHGDTIGGSIVSGDWYGRFTQAIQYELKTSLPVIVLDDASGDVNHFDFRQKIQQSSYKEAVRIGRGYAQIILDALNDTEKLTEEDIIVKNASVTIPHRQVSDEEYAEAKHTLATVPDIKKDGDLESQDLANKVPAALRHFAQRTIDCREKSLPSHEGRVTSISFGKTVSFVAVPGEPFNGVARAIRENSKSKYTFVVSLAQSMSGYVPMPECFERGGYEVQPAVNSVAPNAATELINAALKVL